MYRVIIKNDNANDIIIANIPDEIKANNLADILQGEVTKVKSGNYKFKNYLKKAKKPKLCDNCKKILNI